MRKYKYWLFLWYAFTLFSCTEKQRGTAMEDLVTKPAGKVTVDSTSPPDSIPFSIEPARPLAGILKYSRPFSLDKKYGKPAVSKINTSNGLPNSFFSKLMRDNTGNLWMSQGFLAGLTRYDGLNFINYSNQSNQSFCYQLLLDKTNTFWISGYGYNRGNMNSYGLAKFDGITLSAFTPPELDNDQYKQLALDSKENLWIYFQGTDSIYRYDGQNLKLFTKKDWPGLTKIRNVQSDSSGNLWLTISEDRRQIGTDKVARYDGQHFRIYSKADGFPDSVTSINPVNDSTIWLVAGLSNRSIYRYNGEKTIKVYESMSSSTYPYFDNQGGLWIRTAGTGVTRFKENQLIKVTPADGLSSERIMGIFQDNDGSTWLSSSSNLDRLDWNFLKYDSILPSWEETPFINNIVLDKNGNFWLSGWQSGFSRYDGKSITTYDPDKYAKKNPDPFFYGINSLFNDSRGNLWVATRTGKLLRCKDQLYTTYMIGKDQNSEVGNLQEDSKGNIWFSLDVNNQAKGICCFDGKTIIHYSTKQGLPDNFIASFVEDKKGNYWFGTPKGISRFDGKQFTSYSTEDGLPDNYVDFLLMDDYGNLWIGTDNGLSRYDGERFQNYTRENGLISPSFSSAQRDSVNKLFWLMSMSGLTAMKISANHPDSVVFENYSESEGFPLKTSFFKPVIDEKGIVWIAEWSSNNLIGFDYKNTEKTRKPFPIHLTSIRLNNQEVCWNILQKSKRWKTLQDSLPLYTEMNTRFGKDLPVEELEKMESRFKGVRFDRIISFDFIPENLVLPYSANSVNFEFAAIDPHFSKYTSYQYMLDGQDKDWSRLGKTNYANYSNLSEGTYTFRLKALNSYGLWSEMSYRFKVLPPWYRTWWAYALYALFFISAVSLFIRWRIGAIRQEKKVLEQKVEQRTAELKKSLENLKATQNQLVQSEKMASLGELTAGIAHEIQNPLNFINNFSEVNKELIDEAEQANAEGKTDEVKELLSTMNQNEEKIFYHGKKADAIVKNMLLHSRGGSGTREPVDLNALADECVRLSFHGIRARDKSFNAKYETRFDESVGKINIVQQEIGRVLLNLINNAFYAVSEKAKESIDGFEPLVTVSTRRTDGKIEIGIKDNGKGIPDAVKEKIFQPFFTTKPTGQGTGLGLSLSYDIVKAHGGEITVLNNEDSTGVTFVVRLPG